MPFSVSIFLLQWAIGGLFFLWITTRHRVVGLGYGWLSRLTFGLFAVGAFVADRMGSASPLVGAGSISVAVITFVVLGDSFRRRRAGVAGQQMVAEARSERVAAMTGIRREAQLKDTTTLEFNPDFDLIAPIVGMVALLWFGISEGAGWLAISRVIIGALFLGVVTNAMLLGHWYLVQPGLKRAPLLELVRWLAALWVFEVALFLLPRGMVSVFTGTIDDGYGGILGWFWIACAVSTIGFVAMTIMALREKQYAAVMAATGLLYLAILTSFGIDLVARALLV